MGDEIASSQFSDEDFARYRERLRAETELLAQWFEAGYFHDDGYRAGYELEIWLVDENQQPAPCNEDFLEKLHSDLASPELARFNVELNSTPQALQDHAFSRFHDELTRTWQQCQATARDMQADICAIGILPTVRNEDLNLGNMSQMARYRALNRQVLHLRSGKPLTFDINGVEHLRVVHRDVMLESAATSFQIHLQGSTQESARLYNSAILLSAPMVALSANSPFLFGKLLWEETRIPLFEQAVATGGFEGAKFGPVRRVTFGDRYVRDSLLECFQENLEHYPVMLPEHFDAPVEAMRHLRLHNGTIWRWNRPLIGFDTAGRPQLRVEHRVVPAGPSLIDAIANTAFFCGACVATARQATAVQPALDFGSARDNFYAAARLGLRAQLKWTDGRRLPARELLCELVELAEDGLDFLGIASADINEYLGVIRARLAAATNGSVWQRAWVEKHGRDMAALTRAYMERQFSGEPVHEWSV
ncbi:MAG TPA: glutamate--cysteine ligase [Gammaproteobacteria bacterium]|nr:glutamate--cysteine ligase [Gammaproteobacteria bacterium]